MAGFILMASFVVFLWAVIGLVFPGRAGIPSRAASVGVWVLSVILLVIGTSMLPDDPERTTSTSTSISTGTPASEIPETFQTRIEDALGTSNRSVRRVSEARLQGERLFVRWAINDNLTAGMIRGGARIDIRDMLEVIADGSETYTTVFLQGTFAMVDQLGNASETPVVEATYTKDTVDRINFENFLTDNVYAIAENTDLHPQFR